MAKVIDFHAATGSLILTIVWATSTFTQAETADQAPPKHPPIKHLGPIETYGSHIQRTMSLLAASSPERRRTVRILFYGQSITEQDWWKTVVEDLRRLYPHANLLAENRAIGGFASQLLVKTAETDLYPFYPDLVVLHIYGSHLEYENIIRGIRSRTTAEVLLQTDHMAADDNVDEPTDGESLTPEQWTPWMNASFLPSMAAKYQLELANQRELWKQYLRDYQLTPSALLKDGAHLNEHGCFVMSSIVLAYLRHRPDLSDDEASQTVKDYVIGRDIDWENGKLSLKFDGNRIDAIVRGNDGPAASVLIDGMLPSEVPELYARTPATSFPGSGWPCLLKSASVERPEIEEWSVTLLDVKQDLSEFKFHVAGSKTGPDGEGRSDSRFVSKSGRVVIDPADWNFNYARRVFHRDVPEGFEVRWKVVPQFVDTVVVPSDIDPRVETTVTIAQGLRSGRHSLELKGGAETTIVAIRVYRPPIAVDASQ